MVLFIDEMDKMKKKHKKLIARQLAKSKLFKLPDDWVKYKFECFYALLPEFSLRELRQLEVVINHEILHKEEQAKWNIAADIVVNNTLANAGITRKPGRGIK